MPLIHVILVLIVIGILLWLINRIPMAASIRAIINLVVIIVVVLWLLEIFGLLGTVSTIRIGR